LAGEGSPAKALTTRGNLGTWKILTDLPQNRVPGSVAERRRASGMTLAEIAAFGDDTPDIGMLRLCGLGVAMGNAIPAVKAAADVVIGTNDEDGIAEWLEETLL